MARNWEEWREVKRKSGYIVSGKKINKRKKAKREMSLMLMKLNRERKMVWK